MPVFGRICMTHIGLTLETFCGIWVFNKKIDIILLYDAEQFYVKKQDGGWMKICEIFSGKSLKEDLSIDTTFDPCYFSWDSPFKLSRHAATTTTSSQKQRIVSKTVNFEWVNPWVPSYMVSFCVQPRGCPGAEKCWCRRRRTWAPLPGMSSRQATHFTNKCVNCKVVFYFTILVDAEWKYCIKIKSKMSWLIMI